MLSCVETTGTKIQQLIPVSAHIVHIYNEVSNFPPDNVRHEGRVSSPIAHENPQRERLKGNNQYFQEKKADCDKRVERRTTAQDDRQPTLLHQVEARQQWYYWLIHTYLQPVVPFLHPSTGHPVAFGLGFGFGSGGQRLLYNKHIYYASYLLLLLSLLLKTRTRNSK